METKHEYRNLKTATFPSNWGENITDYSASLYTNIFDNLDKVNFQQNTIYQNELILMKSKLTNYQRIREELKEITPIKQKDLDTE